MSDKRSNSFSHILGSAESVITTDENEIKATFQDSITSPKPFLTCNEMFLRGLTPQPGVNCIHTAVTLGKYLLSKISRLRNTKSDHKC